MFITEAELEELRVVLDLDPDDVRRDYSGRGMMGALCFGFVLDVPDMVVGVALSQVFGDDASEMAYAARTDDMGMSTIVYFPGYTVEADARTSSTTGAWLPAATVATTVYAPLDPTGVDCAETYENATDLG